MRSSYNALPCPDASRPPVPFRRPQGAPPSVKRTPRREEDSAWKHILETHFRQFLVFDFPALHRKIDGSYRPVSLGQEVRRILPRSRGRHAVVDKLLKVRLRSGRRV